MEDLVQVLGKLPAMEHPDLLTGHTRFADAGVFRLRPDLALVQTVDFFPPLVDDPRDYGRIAAANSLSDVYAMGGTPVTALNIAGFPSSKLDVAILGEILAGGAEKVLEAGALVVGGHTVEDAEIKYGLAVTGTLHPDRLITNAGARSGDLLVLTKPLGMGSVTTAWKKHRLDEGALRGAIDIMTTLNRDASRLMLELGAHGATDITGFGLLGHAAEVAEASGVTLLIDASRVPVYPPAREAARRGLFSGAAARNRAHLQPQVLLRASMDDSLEGLLFDSETSGGLLISLEAEAARILVEKLRAAGHEYAAVIGKVVDRTPHLVEVDSVPLE